jgi:hypothetical protein
MSSVTSRSPSNATLRTLFHLIYQVEIRISPHHRTIRQSKTSGYYSGIMAMRWSSHWAAMGAEPCACYSNAAVRVSPDIFRSRSELKRRRDAYAESGAGLTHTTSPDRPKGRTSCAVHSAAVGMPSAWAAMTRRRS